MNKIKQHCENHLVYQGDYFTVDNPFGCKDCRMIESNFQKTQLEKTSAEWLNLNQNYLKMPNREFHIGPETLYWVYNSERDERRAIWKGLNVGVIGVNSLYQCVNIAFCFGMIRMYDNYHWLHTSSNKSVIEAEKKIEEYLSDRPWIFERLSIEHKI